MSVKERHFMNKEKIELVNKKKIEFRISEFKIEIYRRDINGIFEIRIYSDNETSIEFTRNNYLSHNNIIYQKEVVSPLRKEYNFKNVKDFLEDESISDKEKIDFIDKMLNEYSKIFNKRGSFS